MKGRRKEEGRKKEGKKKKGRQIGPTGARQAPSNTMEEERKGTD